MWHGAARMIYADRVRQSKGGLSLSQQNKRMLALTALALNKSTPLAVMKSGARAMAVTSPKCNEIETDK